MLSTLITGDLRNVSVVLDGKLLFASGEVSLCAGGRCHGSEALRPLGPMTVSKGEDALGSYAEHEAHYALSGTQDELLHLLLRDYSGGTLVFEQRFPRGLSNAAPPSGGGPLASFPSWLLNDGLVPSLGWRSWHGSYGSFSGVGLSANDTLVFNGVPTMPILFFAAGGGAAAVASPLHNFMEASHDAHVTAADGGTTWRHGPSSKLMSLPPNFSHAIILSAAERPTATIEAHGRSVRAWHGTDRSAAIDADVTLRALGYWTDNGAFYNMNKWAGNTLPGRRWSPRRDPTASSAGEGCVHSHASSTPCFRLCRACVHTSPSCAFTPPLAVRSHLTTPRRAQARCWHPRCARSTGRRFQSATCNSTIGGTLARSTRAP